MPNYKAKTKLRLQAQIKEYERLQYSMRAKTAGLFDDEAEVEVVGPAKKPVKGSSNDPKRNIPADYNYDPKSLKPLARMLWSLSMALGHAMTAHRNFTKLKSGTISPDGMLGGRGYILSVKDIRKLLFDACENISAISDSIHDEVHAPHWRSKLGELESGEVEKVERLVGDAERILDNPEGEMDVQNELNQAETQGDQAQLEEGEVTEDGGDRFTPDGSEVPDGSESEETEGSQLPGLEQADPTNPEDGNEDDSVDVELNDEDLFDGDQSQENTDGDEQEPDSENVDNSDEEDEEDDSWSEDDSNDAEIGGATAPDSEDDSDVPTDDEDTELPPTDDTDVEVSTDDVPGSDDIDPEEDTDADPNEESSDSADEDLDSDEPVEEADSEGDTDSTDEFVEDEPEEEKPAHDFEPPSDEELDADGETEDETLDTDSPADESDIDNNDTEIDESEPALDDETLDKTFDNFYNPKNTSDDSDESQDEPDSEDEVSEDEGEEADDESSEDEFLEDSDDSETDSDEPEESSDADTQDSDADSEEASSSDSESGSEDSDDDGDADAPEEESDDGKKKRVKKKRSKAASLRVLNKWAASLCIPADPNETDHSHIPSEDPLDHLFDERVPRDWNIHSQLPSDIDTSVARSDYYIGDKGDNSVNASEDYESLTDFASHKEHVAGKGSQPRKRVKLEF